MDQEAASDWRPGSSDDDWSIVDEPEVQRNKVSGEDGKQVLPIVGQRSNFSEDDENPIRKAELLLGDATRLTLDKGKPESLYPTFPSRTSLLPEDSNKGAQIEPDHTKPSLAIPPSDEISRQSAKSDEVSNLAQTQLPVSFGMPAPAAAESMADMIVESIGDIITGTPSSAFARVGRETGSVRSLDTAELEGDPSWTSTDSEGARSAGTSDRLVSGSKRDPFYKEKPFEGRRVDDGHGDGQSSDLEEEGHLTKNGVQLYSGTARDGQSDSEKEYECETEEESVNGRRDAPLPSELGGGVTVAQLEKDIRAASKPLTVEPPDATRYHKILVVGKKGCGKSTFIQCFSSALEDRTVEDFLSKPGSLRPAKYLAMRISGCLEGVSSKHCFMIEELKTDVGQISSALRHCAEKRISYLQNHQFKMEQSRNRTRPMSEYLDNRQDVCLWFMQAVLATEVKEMMQLSTQIPVIPILAKADALTESEVAAKRKELAQLIKAEEKRLTDNGTPPVASPLPAIYKSAGIAADGIFAVAASTEMDYSVNRHGWPIRTYPWGVVEPMLSSHSDLLALTHTLFELAPEQLKVATEDRFSRFRRQQTGFKSVLPCSLQSILIFLFLACCFVGLSFLNFLIWSHASSYWSGSRLSSSVHQIEPAGVSLPYQANATSAAISAKVDELLQYEPMQQDWSIIMPLPAVLDSQASFEKWRNSSVTEAGNDVILVDLLDSLFSSLRIETINIPDAMQGEQSDLCTAESTFQSQEMIEQPSSAKKPKSIQQNLSTLKSKLKSRLAGVEGGKSHKKLRKIAKKMQSAESKLHSHAEKLGKKVQSLLRNVNSKRLLRRVLVANAWL